MPPDPALPDIQETMSYDPRDTREKPGTNPNKGMMTQPYMVAVLITLVVLLVIAIAFVLLRRSSSTAPRTAPATTSGSASPSPQ